LVFVDQDVAVPRVEVGSQFPVIPEQDGCMQQQVVKVDSVGGHQQPLVDRVDLRRYPFVVAHLHAAHHFGGDQAIFGPADHGADRVRRRVSQGHTGEIAGPLDQRLGVSGIQDRIVFAQPG